MDYSVLLVAKGAKGELLQGMSINTLWGKAACCWLLQIELGFQDAEKTNT